MPKLPIVSGWELVEALQKLGFETVRQRGSHIVLRCGSIGCVVPLHRELKTGTLAAIIRQAGLSPETVIEALGG